MDTTFVAYVTYLALSIAVTLWVGRTLFNNGAHFLVDIFDGNDGLADAVNRLLIVGFYLINLGYVGLNLQANPVDSADAALVMVSGKIGFVLLVLGGMHIFNLVVLNRVRHTHLVDKFGPRQPQPPTAPPPAPLGYAPQGPTA